MSRRATTTPEAASDPPLTRHQAATREAILDAAGELFLQRRGHAFSIREVAEAAGMTRRTIYRYFPTREDLIGAVGEHLLPGLVSAEAYEVARDLDEWLASAAEHFAFVEDNFTVFRAVLTAAIGSDQFLVGLPPDQRDSRHWRLFRERFPNLDEADAVERFAMLRQQTSSITYLMLRGRFALSPSQATDVILEHAHTMVDAAERADRDAGG